MIENFIDFKKYMLINKFYYEHVLVLLKFKQWKQFDVNNLNVKNKIKINKTIVFNII